ncbi:MAG TPA: hypothetical protein VGU63_05035 [Candidatus Acidoferrales bacterium]|nr:hypothetical protein [Candidatus Acidoferrales bacterium]
MGDWRQTQFEPGPTPDSDWANPDSWREVEPPELRGGSFDSSEAENTAVNEGEPNTPESISEGQAEKKDGGMNH